MGQTKAKFKINSSYESPEHIDYSIIGLHKKRTITAGELVLIEYYKNYDGVDYTNLVVREERVFTRDAIGIVQYRTMVIKWYLEDDTIGYTKNSTKYYTPEEAIQEGVDRRNNMISFAKTTLLNELKLIHGEPTNQSYAFDLLLSVKTQMDYFLQGYTQPLRDAIDASVKPYLTSDIKAKIITELTF